MTNLGKNVGIVLCSAMASGLTMSAPWSLVGAQETPVTATASVPSQSATSRAGNAALQRMIALDLHDVSLHTALTTIQSLAGIPLTFGEDQLPSQVRITLVSNAITVADALHTVLQGTGLRLFVSSVGALLVEPSEASGTNTRTMMQQGTSTISGSVRDSATRAAIPQVLVRVNGTTLEATSGSDGQYKISGLVAGEYKVTARRVGYIAASRTATVSDGETKKLNFDLSPPATQLNDVVTTALGDQRRYQVGNVIATINVDSLAPTVPATSVTDILSGRVPGMEVEETDGMVGSGQAIRIRGQGSLLLQTDPIIIVDGMRVDNDPGSSSIFFAGQTASPSRINDIDFSEIASIDVLKGPAATTEYGTDAANGVIVITTKRGVAGRPQWHFSVDQAEESVPTGFSNFYYSWGHTTEGVAAPVVCPLSAGAFPPLEASLSGNCVVDSITAFNPLNDAATSVYSGSAPYGRYNASVSGGTETVRYFVDGGVSNAVGNTHVPGVFRAQAEALGFPSSAFSPNSQNQRSTRATTSIHLNDVTDVQVSGSYMSTFQQAPGSEQFVSSLGQGPAVPDSAYNYGYGFVTDGTGIGCGASNCSTAYSPLLSLGQDYQFSDQRWLGNVVTSWNPSGLVHVNLTLGIDHGALNESNRYLPQAENAMYPTDTASGSLAVSTAENDIYTFDLRGAATVPLIGRLRGQTALGVQYVQTNTSGLYARAQNLSIYDFSITGTNYTSSVTQEQITAGAYVEETFSYGDRLFIPVALRLDAGSGFGATSQFAGQYPKYGGSYLLLNGPTTLRVRASYGAAGQQPPYGASLGIYTPNGAFYPGQQIGTGLFLSTAGNEKLKPETGTEIEAGADLSTLHNRVNLTATYYSNYRHNALWTTTLGFDLNNLQYTENIGDIRNAGTEFTLDAVLIQSRLAVWSVSFNTSLNTNILVHLAPNVIQANAGGNEYFVPGYPIYAYWGQKVHVINESPDGIVNENNVGVDTGLSYVGPSLPRQETSVSTSVGLFRGTLSLNALFDAKSLYLVDNNNYTDPNVFDSDPAVNEPTAPTWQQVRDDAETVVSYGCCHGTSAAEFLNGAFVRWRELSVAYAMPRSLLRASPVKNASLVAKLRNVYLWTRYPFGDPEVSNGTSASTNPVSGARTVNNDIRSTNNSVTPLPRFFDLGLNLGF